MSSHKSLPHNSNELAVQLTLTVNTDSHLSTMIQGKTVAVLGQPLENHTTDAYEFSRGLMQHQQLVCARRLRFSLEDAANRVDALPDDSPTSYAEAMSILQLYLPQINDLVRLTESLRGNYVIYERRDYSEWNEWTRKSDEIDEAQQLQEHRIIRHQLRELGMEANTGLEVDTELEQRHDALMLRPKLEPIVENVRDSKDRGWKKHSRPKQRRKIHHNHTQKKKSVPKDMIPVSHPINQPNGNRKVYSPTTHLSTELFKESSRVKTTDEFSNKCTQPKREETKFQAADETKSSAKTKIPDCGELSRVRRMNKKLSKKCPPESTFQQSHPSTFARQMQTTKPSTTKPIKKCHDCKECTSGYRKCNYWHMTGSKCGKAFCITCLSSKYTLGDDVLSDTNPNGLLIEQVLDNDWHCPSCLKTCRCTACVKQRERDELREKSRDMGIRKISRRSGL